MNGPVHVKDFLQRLMHVGRPQYIITFINIINIFCSGLT